MDEQTAARVRVLIAKGVLGPTAFDVDDCAAMYAHVSVSGVTFLSEPGERPCGIEPTLCANSDSGFSMTERPRARAAS